MKKTLEERIKETKPYSVIVMSEKEEKELGPKNKKKLREIEAQIVVI
jgi:hypothetical protein